MSVSLGSRRMRQQCIEAARVIARSLVDSTQIHGSIRGHRTSLAYGYPGIALAFLELDRLWPDEGWGRVALNHFRVAVGLTNQEPLATVGLWQGLAGFGYVADVIAPLDPSLERISTQVENAVLGVSAFVATAEPWTYDVVSGASGLLFYIMRHQSDSRARALAAKFLEGFVDRTLSGSDGPSSLGNWLVPPKSPSVAAVDLETFPQGYIDLGFAHGVSGVLASLAACWFMGLRVPGQQDVIRVLSDGLIAYASVDEWGPYWPKRVSPSGTGSPRVPAGTVTRPSWCYGAAGIARSLALAGGVTGDKTALRLSSAAMMATLNRPEPSVDLVSAGICHGKAGLATGLLLGCPELLSGQGAEAVAYTKLVRGLLTDVQLDLTFGVRDWDPLNGFTDDPGLLSGAAGTLLALACLGTGCQPDWASVLFLGSTGESENSARGVTCDR